VADRPYLYLPFSLPLFFSRYPYQATYKRYLDSVQSVEAIVCLARLQRELNVTSNPQGKTSVFFSSIFPPFFPSFSFTLIFPLDSQIFHRLVASPFVLLPVSLSLPLIYGRNSHSHRRFCLLFLLQQLPSAALLPLPCWLAPPAPSTTTTPHAPALDATRNRTQSRQPISISAIAITSTASREISSPEKGTRALSPSLTYGKRCLRSD
jgi:hypothetical protein